jgi:hypothetical protein
MAIKQLLRENSCQVWQLFFSPKEQSNPASRVKLLGEQATDRRDTSIEPRATAPKSVFMNIYLSQEKTERRGRFQTHG